ncbi:MAG: MFS transporter [Actinoplanes sp.]
MLSAVLLIIGGRLGDRWGRRRLFLIGAIGFTLASVVCAAAMSPTVLVAARVGQGALGALMIPQGFGVLSAVFADERERGRAFSLFGPVSGLAGVGGPILAGALIAWNLGGLDWRLIFLVNVPLGLHYSPLHAGLALAPVAAGIAASSLLAPALAARLGRVLLHVGLGVEILGVAGLAVVAATGAPAPALAAAALGTGLGLGLLFGPLIQRILAVAAPDEIGSASGTLNAAQQIATALGVAVLGTVFFAAPGPRDGLVTGSVLVAASGLICAALVLLLPQTPSPKGMS